MTVIASGNPSINVCPSCASSFESIAPAPVDTNTKKCVVVVDADLALGSLVNTAAVLGVSLGKLRSEMVGRDLPDSSGFVHHGITTMPIPVLKADAAFLKGLRLRLKELEPELLVIDVISATRTTRSYDEYASVLEANPEDQVEYFGLALYGDKKTVARFTGGLALLR